MKLFRATILHTPQNPFQQGGMEGCSDGGLLVEGGRVRALETTAMSVGNTPKPP